MYGAPGLHRAHCRTSFNQGLLKRRPLSDCIGVIVAHAAEDCPTTSPPSCCFYVAGARRAYGARAPERVPAVPPALALPALDLAERARAEHERDLAERKLLLAHCVPTPGIYDDFEANSASALLLLAHNTNPSAPFLPCSGCTTPASATAASLRTPSKIAQKRYTLFSAAS